VVEILNQFLTCWSKPIAQLFYCFKLKFQTVAEKTAKNFRGLLYFAAPGRCRDIYTI